MNKQYLSIKEAIEVTGMSDASLRRLCRKGVKDRDYKYDTEGKLFINDLFLYTSYPPLSKPYSSPMNIDYETINSLQTDIALFKDLVKHFPSELMNEKDKRIDDLKKEIETKNATVINLTYAIEGLNHNISLLTERTREQNIIIQTLQDKVSHQLKPADITYSPAARQKRRIGLIDKALIGVAILSSLAILSFIGIMLFAYFAR